MVIVRIHTFIILCLTSFETSLIQVNSFKYKCYHDSIFYLLFVVTREVTNPQTGKLKAIMGIQYPKTKHHIIHFIGVVNFHEHLCKKKTHMLSRLIKILVNNS